MIRMLIVVTYHLGEDLLSREGRALSKYYARPGLHHTRAIWMEIIKKLRPQPYIGIWSESKLFARWYCFSPVVQKAPVALSPILANKLGCRLVEHPSCHVLGLKVAITTRAQHQSPQSTLHLVFQISYKGPPYAWGEQHLAGRPHLPPALQGRLPQCCKNVELSSPIPWVNKNMISCGSTLFGFWWGLQGIQSNPLGRLQRRQPRAQFWFEIGKVKNWKFCSYRRYYLRYEQN